MERVVQQSPVPTAARRTLWLLRLGWTLLTLGILVVVAGPALPLAVKGAVGLLIPAVLLLLLLTYLGRLPEWHDWLWALLALPLLSALMIFEPAAYPVWLLLALFVIADVGQAYGIAALLSAILFPLPPLVYMLINGTVEPLLPPLIAVWVGLAIISMMYPRSRTPRAQSSAPPPPVQDHALSAIQTQLARQLVQGMPHDMVLTNVVNAIGDLLDAGGRRQARVMSLLYRQTNTDELAVSATRNLDLRTGEHSFPASGTLGEMLQSGTPLLTDAQQPPFNQVRVLANHQLLLLPLSMSLDIYGAIVAATPDAARLARPEVQEALAGLAAQASMAFYNASLQQERRVDISSRLLSAEETRHQLARDLHDGPVQRVAAIAMQIEFIKALIHREPASSIPELDQLQATANQAAQEMRTMLFTLRPVVMESEGVSAALRTLVERLHGQEHVNISFQSDPLPSLPPRTDDVLFSIMQEAIGNAKKYSKGKPIHVRLIRGNNMVIGQVEDSGPGFDLPTVMASYGTRASLGLINMQERAALIGGQLRIDTAPGEGTLVSIAVPHSRS